MAQTEYKPTTCQNCGHYSHCGETLWKAVDHREPEHEVKVCEHCRCKECAGK
jgi:hypothetical protein